MDTSIRVILILIGSLLLIGIIWDIFKKKVILDEEIEEEPKEVLKPKVQPKVELPKEEPPAPPKPVLDPNKIFSIFVVSKPQNNFMGKKLIAILQTMAMHFGKHNIFHRFKYTNGTGDYLFSLASASEPGTFNLDKIHDLNYTGIILFFAVNEVEDPIEALDQMLKTAKQLAFRLNAELLDQNRELLTINQIEEYKSYLQELVFA